jgi:putative ABC transport system substrate-binding protein
LKDLGTQAKILGLKLRIFEVQRDDDLERSFSTIEKERLEALIELPNPFFHSNRKPIVDFALRSRMPSIFHSRDFVDAGGLMSYGAEFADMFRRAAIFVDKILKGAKPANLPIEQPTKFEFLVNLKTARQIGVTIAPNVVARADQVIR